jgi:hypothetical protein
MESMDITSNRWLGAELIGGTNSHQLGVAMSAVTNLLPTGATPPFRPWLAFVVKALDAT